MSNTKKIFLVRHGESIQNVGINNKLRMPDHSIYLTDNGLIQAENAGQFLKENFKANGIVAENCRLWVSPYERTRQTAKEINKYLEIKDMKEDERLVEQQFGMFDSVSDEDAEKNFPEEWKVYENCKRYNGKFYARLPNGESPFDVEMRIHSFLETVFRDFDEDDIDNLIIVTHGTVSRVFAKVFFHYSHEWYAKQHNPGNCWIRQINKNFHIANEDLGYIYKG
jgi:broad specificity phosphatase PhoE